MRKTKAAVLAAAAGSALMLVAQPTPAGADDPLAASCTSAGLVTGITLLGNMPKCSTGPVQCPTASDGCSFTARLEGVAATAVGPTRCRLRLKDPDTGAVQDFYSSGGPTRCNVLEVRSFQPPGQRYVAVCSYTRANVGVLATINCSAAFDPLGA